MENKRILLADDNRHLRLLVKTALTHHDYDVLEAEDGERAIEMAVEERPDLILLDVMMPKLNGYEVLKFLRKRPETQSCPVVMLTTAKLDLADDLYSAAQGYVRKPFAPSELLEAVNTVLRSDPS